MIIQDTWALGTEFLELYHLSHFFSLSNLLVEGGF